MKPFYELYRDYENGICVTKRTDYSFPAHFHASMEILILLDGKYKISIDNQTYIAENKSVSVSDSFCIHAFTKLSEGPSDSMLIIIPSNCLNEYNNIKKGKSLASNVTRDGKVVDEIRQIAENMMAHDKDEQIKKNYADVILALLVSALGLKTAPQQKSISTIKNILLYIEKNFKEDLTLESIADHFGYSACHLSRMFHSYFQISISKYINTMRLQYIENNKKDADKLSTLIFEAGFKSPQTYYRNLKSYKSQP